MKIIRITKFQAEDGTEFDTETDARRHNLAGEFSEKLDEVLHSALSTGRADSGVKALLANATEVRDILNGYIRRCPKQPVEQREAA